MTNTNPYRIIASYKFFSWPEGTDFKAKATEIELWALEHGILGLLLIGKEGFNGTMSCPSEEARDLWLAKLQSFCAPLTFEYKESLSEFQPFRRAKVKVKKEIVTLGDETVLPASEKDHSHLSPEEWENFIRTKNPVVLDVRNDYEMEIGKFRTAKDWAMKEFTEFPKLVEDLELDKEEPVLMYCTGGIRCEKASIEMRRQGYKNVYQLDGGILNYIKERPHGEFEGECFVFDHRVAVDQDLKPSLRYGLCVHCGQPASLDPLECVQCHAPAIVCTHCLEDHQDDSSIQTCSKNCRHHYKMGHKSTKTHWDAKREYKKLSTLPNKVKNA